MKKAFIGILAASVLMACADKSESPPSSKADSSAEKMAHSGANPLLEPWDTPYGIPPFDKIEDQHFRPAFDEAMKTLREEVDGIAGNEQAPTFENTIVALEQAGGALTRIMSLFTNLTSTDTNDTLKALQVEIYPELTRQRDAILLNAELFQRVTTIYQNRDPLKLDQQDSRLLALAHRDFIRAGAALDAAAKQRLKNINADISKLTTQFAQNLLAETKNFTLIIDEESDLAGLPNEMINAAKAKAKSRDLPEAWIFGLDRATFEGFMTFSEKRRLRKVMFDGYRARGANGNEFDNRDIVLQIARLRAQRAALLGYETHAHYQLETRMAKSPANAEAFLQKVWAPGLKKAAQEKAEMQAIIASEGENFTLAGHDWWHYAEKLRAQKYAFDESQVKPYFELDNVLKGAFHVAEKLFGVQFRQRHDTPVWHPKVKVFEVTGRGDEHLGVFLVDFYSRDSKRGGAWMSALRSSSAIDGEQIRPLITNNLNLTPPAAGDPTLLSFDQVNTLFHEFGHGLHGLMTTARYKRFAGTSGSPRDFTEFPAQFMEHYAAAPEVLPVYALHHQSGEVIPPQLLNKLQSASAHNQGFKTTEFIAASLLDMAWHQLDSEAADQVTDVEAFEANILQQYGLPEEIGPRYRSPYFAHIFSSPSGYSAGYYAYLWSEILDADGFTAFRESGNIFNEALSARLAEHVYQAGGRAPADELYRRFRQQEPSIEPLLKIRGLN